MEWLIFTYVFDLLIKLFIGCYKIVPIGFFYTIKERKHSYYSGKVNSQNEAAFRIINWIVPGTWIGIFIGWAERKIKSIINWWRNLPAK